MSNLSDMGAPLTSGGAGFEPVAEGIYDFYVHGVIGMGMQARRPYEGQERAPAPTVKVILELPTEVRDDKQTQVVGYKIVMSPHPKGNLYKFCRLILGSAVTEDNMSDYVSSVGLKKLLGGVGSLTIKHFEMDKGKSAVVDGEGFNRMDARLIPHMAQATRPTFFFNPFNPDLEVFNNTLTYWTKKEVMSALNADQFPSELHQAWAKAQEEQLAKEAGKSTGDKKATVAPIVSGDVGAIE